MRISTKAFTAEAQRTPEKATLNSKTQVSLRTPRLGRDWAMGFLSVPWFFQVNSVG